MLTDRYLLNYRVRWIVSTSYSSVSRLSIVATSQTDEESIRHTVTIYTVIVSTVASEIDIPTEIAGSLTSFARVSEMNEIVFEACWTGEPGEQDSVYSCFHLPGSVRFGRDEYKLFLKRP